MTAWWWWGLLAVAFVVLLSVTLHTAIRVRRLDRLHRRTDAAAAGLESALDRRAQAALAVADVLVGAGRDGGQLRHAVAAARAAHRPGHERIPDPRRPDPRRPDPRRPDSRGTGNGRIGDGEIGDREIGDREIGDREIGDREAAENALGRVLARVERALLPPAVLEELVDAEQLVILARRVHNDAVRDTLGLRARRLVRWLHLAGTAPLPRYFDIADPEPGPGPPGVTTAVPVAARGAPAGRPI